MLLHTYVVHRVWTFAEHCMSLINNCSLLFLNSIKTACGTTTTYIWVKSVLTTKLCRNSKLFKSLHLNCHFIKLFCLFIRKKFFFLFSAWFSLFPVRTCRIFLVSGTQKGTIFKWKVDKDFPLYCMFKEVTACWERANSKSVVTVFLRK